MRTIVGVLSFALLLCGPVFAEVARPVFDVPRLGGIAIDGSGEDWADRGFRVELMAGPKAQLYPPRDFGPAMRLGWNTEGLLVLVTVTDEAAVENEQVDGLFWNDCVELFPAESLGSQNRYQILVAPGADPQFKELRSFIGDHRAARFKKGTLEVRAASHVRDDGYTVEVLLPWSNLRTEPRMGMETALNVIVDDSDLERGPNKQRDRAMWYPSGESWQDPDTLHRLRLARAPGEPSAAVATGQVDVVRARLTVQVAASGPLAGREVVLTVAGRELDRTTLEGTPGGARTTLTAELESVEDIPDQAAVAVEAGRVLPVPLPGVQRQLAWEITELGIRAGWFCFSDAKFPPFYFTHPLVAEKLLGPYEIEVEHYNADFEPMETPGEPGRYGAVVTIGLKDGRVTRRYRTLFHHPLPLHQWTDRMAVSWRPPEGLGIDPDVVARHADEMSEHGAYVFFQGGCLRRSATAAILAGLYGADPEAEASGGPADSLLGADRQWWVTMKRKLNGMAQKYPDPFVCPRPMEGPPAPVIREGTPQEAGVKPDAAEAIDAVLTEWAGDTNEPFSVCVARHGVIVLHRAYPVDDPDYTVNTPTWMASITKLMSGTLMMMLVDQGLVDLDAEVGEYLPALRGIDAETPLTVRHLYTHTNGLWGHWGDEMHDLEHVVATIYPHLEVGRRHEYNGVGYGLGGKIIEMLTGEAIPQFYRAHLLGPLGLEHTHLTGTYADAHSVPLDMAKIGQMLLNGGAYGRMRFFSEETFAKMLPASIEHLREEPGADQWGIGTTWRNPQPDGPNLPGARAFGHGAASAATLIIDPEWELVIVMTRNAAGSNFQQYHPRFIEAVYASIADGN
ncbi:MAG: serine hydrolase [Candidatus Brocadiaceae bacterium]|jgi:CubicO group peptidase (beta-lactamase class C family)